MIRKTTGVPIGRLPTSRGDLSRANALRIATGPWSWVAPPRPLSRPEIRLTSAGEPILVTVPRRCPYAMEPVLGRNSVALGSAFLVSMAVRRKRHLLMNDMSRPHRPARTSTRSLRLRGMTVGQAGRGNWRRERDSNPRYGFPYTHFPGVRLQPLGHPSAAPGPTGPKQAATLTEPAARGNIRLPARAITPKDVTFRIR